MGRSQKIDLQEILLRGNFFDIGVQHGELLGRDIRNFLQRDFADINSLRTHPLNEKLINEYVLPYKKIIAQYLPDIMVELEGLAKGAEITIDQAVLLQIRRELIGTKDFTLLGDCSSFAMREPGRVVLGQTIDLPGNMTSLGQVLKIRPDKTENPEVILYSFSGLLGYMGMNSFGVAVCINLVISDGWRVGVPPYLLVRAFLNCKNISECIELVKTIPVASSRSFIISDKEKQIVLELTPTGYCIVEDSFLTHTNHYIHKELIEKDRLNIFSRNSSNKRKQLLEKGLKNDSTLEGIKKLFADHSLFPVGMCAHNESNFKWTETVAAVIMYPERGEFFALKGKPCQEEFELFKL